MIKLYYLRTDFDFILGLRQKISSNDLKMILLFKSKSFVEKIKYNIIMYPSTRMFVLFFSFYP